MGLTNCLEELKGNGIKLENILALYISVNYGEHNEKYREIKYAKYKIKRRKEHMIYFN